MALVSDDQVHQFVQEVVDFSSQYGSEMSISYTFPNLIGQCNVFPNYGDYTQTAVLRTYGPWWSQSPSASKKLARTPETFISQDFVELSFKEKVFPTEIEVFETYNPGSVVRVLACDTSSWSSRHPNNRTPRWFVLWQGQPQNVPPRSTVFSPKPLNSCPFPTNLIRLEFNHLHLQYYAELDAVCLHGIRPRSSRSNHSMYANGDLLLSDPDSNHQSSRLDGILDPPGSKTAEILARGFAHLHVSDGLSAALDVSDNGYFDALPEEVIQFIISFLDYKSLCRLSLTSHLLRKHCYDPLQYTELDLQPYWTKICDSSLTSLQSRCVRTKYLSLSWCGGYDRITCSGFSSFIKACSSELICLRLNCCRFLENSALSLIASECRHLKELQLQCCAKIASHTFAQLAKLADLEILNLYRTLVDTTAINTVIRSCKRMKQLNLGACSNITSYDDVAFELGKNCKFLNSIDFWRAKSLTHAGLSAIYNNCPYLEEIDLGWCSDLRSGTGCFVGLVKNCTLLKKLFLTANRTVCDNDLEAIAHYSRRLQQLDILGTREVSQQAVLKVLTNCTNLHFFDLSFCSGIDESFFNHAAITTKEWFDKYGHVDIKRSFQMGLPQM